MADDIHVVPDQLRQAADRHRETAECLAAVPASHAAIQASLDSLGPIYGGLARAGRLLLDERRRSYEDQAAEHARVAQNLSAAAALWEEHEAQAAAALGAVLPEVGDGPR